MNEVRDVFDDWARRGRAEGMEHGHGPTARQAFDRLEVGAGTRYLDIGCGSGYTVRWAAAVDPAVRAVGVDLSAGMIERARESTTATNAEMINAPFPTDELAGPFDAVFSMEVFYYLPDLAAGLRAVRELLATDGLFACVVDFYTENTASHTWSADMGLDLHLLSVSEWADAFATAGLDVVEQSRLHPPLADGETPTWKHQEGSLMTLGRRRP
jgi:cyclopropane fatty-acyl-phospholipid synthase-like methyltransferase